MHTPTLLGVVAYDDGVMVSHATSLSRDELGRGYMPEREGERDNS